MKLKLIGSIAIATLLSVAAFSQTSALPAAPGTAETAAPAASAPNPNARVAAINVEQAIFATNEGQRDMGALQKKFEPKSTDLKTKGEELDALKKKQAATTTTAAEKEEIGRQVEQKQKALEREQQDAREDFQGQTSEVGQRIFQKMIPVITKYAEENSVGMLIDTSVQWPQGPVLYSAPLDITPAIVTAYNAVSGVAAPPAGTVKPQASGRPTAPATRPATTTPAPATKPPTTTPAPK
jgi:outer membrane protein